MRTLDLDALLGDDEPEATFHDACVEEISFDAKLQSVKVEVLAQVRSFNERPRYRPGVLVFSQVQLFAVEPQRSAVRRTHPAGLWLTSEGSVESLPPDRYCIPPLSTALPDDGFFHYLYFSDTNSFAFIAASEVRFSWSAESLEGCQNAV